MSKLQYLLILAFMAAVSAATAQNRLAMTCKGATGLFMPEVSVGSSDSKLDGAGWQQEFGLGIMPTWGVTLSSSVVFGQSDLEMKLSNDQILESDVLSSALFLDVNYDFLNAIPDNRVSVIGGFGTGLAYNKLGASKLVGADIERTEGDGVAGFAFRVSLTARVNITEAFGVYVAYQYQDLGNVQMGDTTYFGGIPASSEVEDMDLTASFVGVGVEYKF